MKDRAPMRLEPDLREARKWLWGVTAPMVFAVVAAALGVVPAHATVLAEDELEETSTELGVVARSFSFVLMGDVLEPPFSPVDANPSGTGILDMRGYFVHRTASLKLVLHAQLTTSVRSHGAFGALAFGRGVAPSRWLPLTTRLVDEPTLAMVGAVDWFYGSWTHGAVTVTAGRQPITFGRAKLFSPTDLVATFALTEVDTEYKPGADAVRVDWSASERLTVSVVASTGELATDNDLDASLQGTTVLARGKWAWQGGEAGVLAGAVRGDVVTGADMVLDMGSFELVGEATVTALTGESLDAPGAEPGDVRARAALGATFRPGEKLTVSPELHYNGFGADTADEYLDIALSPRVAIGEQTTLGRYHAGLVCAWDAHPLVQIGGAALANLGDPSGLLSIALRASLANNTDAVLGGYLGVGKTPVLDAAAGTLRIRDEFGLYPGFVFAELKTVF